MAIMDQLIGEAYNIVARSESNNDATPAWLVARQQSSTAPSPTPPPQQRNNNPTSSPLLFFVALGFGVVFTNLWIIVGVKYCFRYNARNRALRNGEDPDQINMENMPTRPHRRRKEKKLMTMDEVNERFPLTKYKTWVAGRLSAGLPTAGGVTASASRAASLRNVEATVPTSPVETKHSTDSRPATASPDAAVPATNTTAAKEPTTTVEKDKTKSDTTAVNTTRTEDALTPPLTKQVSGDDDDDDDHIHTAVPPELLTNPGDSCAICIDTLEDDDDIRGLTCGHAFHAGCLDPWLTSRRACCPLCKADYFTPKPRPEGEVAAETERSARRRGGDPTNMNLPQEPRSAWAGFRGSPRMIFSSVTVDRHNREARNQSRSRQDVNATTTPEASSTPAPTQSRWRSALGGMRLPGRNRAAEQPANSTTEPTPGQLEAGTANTTTVR